MRFNLGSSPSGPVAAPPLMATTGSYARGQARWPSLALSLDGFERHYARLGLDEQQAAARAEDLFLVAAVLEQVPQAVAHFDQCLSAAARVAARIDRAPASSTT